jgi:uracil-DNA glycosylase
MIRAGFKDREEFRRQTYIAALMRCFPGRNRQNSGDLRPPPEGVANCAHWLDAELKLLRPKMIILVGQMAIARFLGPGSLEDRVGKSFGQQPLMIPLPHPSGQNRWLNAQVNRERLASALDLINDVREREGREVSLGVLRRHDAREPIGSGARDETVDDMVQQARPRDCRSR